MHSFSFNICSLALSPIFFKIKKERPNAIQNSINLIEDEEKRTEYCEKYVDFLKVVRKNNPSAKIVCCLGIMTERLCPYVEKVADAYTAETGDGNISTLRFTVQLPEDGLAANYHPTSRTHKKAAEKLADYLKTII